MSLDFPQMDTSKVMVELEKWDDEELKKLLNSESFEQYDEWISQSDQYKSLESEREMLMASVRSLAEYNLSRQSKFESDRSQLLAHLSEAKQLKDDIESKEEKLLDLAKKTSLESTLTAVLQATSLAEEESENIAKKFIENSLEFETFIKEYGEKRKLAHSRRIKAERLKQVLNSNTK